jgi:hypothetical protein
MGSQSGTGRPRRRAADTRALKVGRSGGQDNLTEKRSQWRGWQATSFAESREPRRWLWTILAASLPNVFLRAARFGHFGRH